jgi:SAM-dependent methyltransferase
MAEGYDAELYALLHCGNPGDIEFYLAGCAGVAEVLELGCGSGRVLAALATAGHNVVGVDLHEGLLERAARRIADLPSATLLRGDITELDLGRRFDRVIIPYNTLYCLLDDAAVAAALSGARRHLSPGGQLLLDVYAADPVEPGEAVDEQAFCTPQHIVTLAGTAATIDVFERSRENAAEQRLDVTYTYVIRADDGEVTAPEYTLPQRYLFEPQLRQHLYDAGFEVLRFEGDFCGSPFALEHLHMVVTAVPIGSPQAGG